MTTTVNGVPLRCGRLVMPLVGVWHLVGELDAEEVPSVGASATIDLEGSTLTGTVRRSGVETERVEVQIVGGAGGLSADVPPKFYSQPSVRIVILDILTSAGESLSPTADAAILGGFLPTWTRAASTHGAALDAIVAAVGATWRVLEDGSVWIGRNAWSAQTLVDAELVDDTASTARRVFADDLLAARPGRTIDGIRTALVVHCIEPGRYRTEAWPLRESSEESDPMRAAFAGAVRRVMRHVDYHAHYAGRVVSQAANLSLDVQLDVDTMPPVSGVRLAMLAPQVEVKVLPGARVLIGWQDGDPQKPYASLWEGGSLTSIAIAGSSDAAALASLVLGQLQNIATALTTHVHSGVTTGPGTSGTAAPVYTPAAVASTKLLLGG